MLDDIRRLDEINTSVDDLLVGRPVLRPQGRTSLLGGAPKDEREAVVIDRERTP